MKTQQVKDTLFKQVLTAINSGYVTFIDYAYANGKTYRQYRTFKQGALQASSNIR